MKFQHVCVAAILGMAVTTGVQAQVKIGANPASISPTSGLEVEASTPGRTTTIDKTTGQVTIKDGTQGAGKVFTSDANGGGSWQSKESLRVDQTVFVGEQAGSYTVTDWGGTFNAEKDRIPLNVRAGSLPGWNATTKQYTIQETGRYRVFGGAALAGAEAPSETTTTKGIVYLGPWTVLNQYAPLNNAVGPVLPLFWEANLNAGDVVTLWITNQSSGGSTTQDIHVNSAFLSIVKLY